MDTPHSDVAEVTRLLMELAGARFYGSIEFRFESGRVTTIRKTETLKRQVTMAVLTAWEKGGA